MLNLCRKPQIPNYSHIPQFLRSCSRPLLLNMLNLQIHQHHIKNINHKHTFLCQLNNNQSLTAAWNFSHAAVCRPRVVFNTFDLVTNNIVSGKHWFNHYSLIFCLLEDFNFFSKQVRMNDKRSLSCNVPLQWKMFLFKVKFNANDIKIYFSNFPKNWCKTTHCLRNTSSRHEYINNNTTEYT